MLEVVTTSTPCSATCGLGLKTETLCELEDNQSAVEEQSAGSREAKVTRVCRVRRVKCQESWQCELRTRTTCVGQRVELDCLGEVMRALGRFSWRVSWRHAHGVISSDDSLFARFKAPLLDRLVLDPVQEEHAGTYRCEVKDANFRRVKRAYWGVRVLPPGILDLDYESSLDHWNQNQTSQQQTLQISAVPHLNFLYMFLVSLGVALVLTGLIYVGLVLRRRRRVCRSSCFPNMFRRTTVAPP
ncbi:unnamed protein product [Ophioblennius macclurei]